MSKPAPSKPTIAAPTLAFYVQLFFIVLSLALGTCALLANPRPLLQWFPSLLLLVAASCALSALIYLNKGITYRSRTYLLLYVLLTTATSIFRLLVASLLLLGLWTGRVGIKWAFSLVILSFVHSFVDFVLIWKITAYRQSIPSKRTPLEKKPNTKNEGLVLVEGAGAKNTGKIDVEELAVYSLNKEMTQSKSTLFTYASELND